MTDNEPTFFAHLRGRDRERVGWIQLTADGCYVAYDLLWRPVCASDQLEHVEAALEELGLRYLSQDWLLATDDGPRLVQIAEVTKTTVTVAPVIESEAVAKAVDLGQRVVLPNPTDLLRPAA